MPKPKLILDTNVAQTLLQPNYQPDLNRIVGRISSRFQVVVSPQTYLELLNSVLWWRRGACRGSQESTSIDRWPGEPRVLAIPGGLCRVQGAPVKLPRSEEHTPDLHSLTNRVCR